MSVLEDFKEVFATTSIRGMIAILITVAYYGGAIGLGLGLGLQALDQYTSLVGFAIAAVMTYYFEKMRDKDVRDMLGEIDARNLVALISTISFFLGAILFAVIVGIPGLLRFVSATVIHFGVITSYFFVRDTVTATAEA